MLRRLLLLALLAGLAAAAGESEATASVSEQQSTGRQDTEEIRRSYLDHWRDASGSGLERFSSTVQLVVDTRARMTFASRDEAVRAVLDDLVDLFVGPEYQLEKTLAMLSAPLLGGGAITEGEGDLSGFAPKFQAGEGRFRHFALNAAASYAVPETLVAITALLRGGDLRNTSPENAGDRAADIATNRIGREFTRLLRKRPLSELGGGRVEEWLIERFGDR